MQSTLRYVLSGHVLRRNLLIALVVCCVLSLINQFDELLSGQFSLRLAVQVLLNFLVPLTVSSVSAAVNRPNVSRTDS